MKAIVIHEHGGPEQLRLEEVAEPKPAADEACPTAPVLGPVAGRRLDIDLPPANPRGAQQLDGPRSRKIVTYGAQQQQQIVDRAPLRPRVSRGAAIDQD